MGFCTNAKVLPSRRKDLRLQLLIGWMIWKGHTVQKLAAERSFLWQKESIIVEGKAYWMLLKGLGVRYAQEKWRRHWFCRSTSLLLIKSAVPPKHISHRWPKQSKLKTARGRNIWDLIRNNIKISVLVQFYPCFKFYFLLLQTHHHACYYLSNHNYNKIVKSDWLSTALISALIGQFNRTVRVMPK